jgi:hypothetical protein
MKNLARLGPVLTGVGRACLAVTRAYPRLLSASGRGYCNGAMASKNARPPKRQELQLMKKNMLKRFNEIENEL